MAIAIASGGALFTVDRFFSKTLVVGLDGRTAAGLGPRCVAGPIGWRAARSQLFDEVMAEDGTGGKPA